MLRLRGGAFGAACVAQSGEIQPMLCFLMKSGEICRPKASTFVGLARTVRKALDSDAIPRRAAITAARFAAEPENGLLENLHSPIPGRQTSHFRCSYCILPPDNIR